jgi:hypothetical protein
MRSFSLVSLLGFTPQVFRAKTARFGRICFALFLPSVFCKLLIKSVIPLHGGRKNPMAERFFYFF